MLSAKVPIGKEGWIQGREEENHQRRNRKNIFHFSWVLGKKDVNLQPVLK